MSAEKENTVISFLRGGGEPTADENEEYARVYLDARGPANWLSPISSKQIRSIRRELYPFYVVPVPNRGGHWIVDATRPIAISAFDGFDSTLLIAQLSYLLSERRTSLDFSGESGQALFDHVSGTLLDYTRLQDDFNRDLSSMISGDFLTKDYLAMVGAAKQVVGTSCCTSSRYRVGVSEKINPMFTWDEAFGMVASIEKQIGIITEYLRRCNDSISQLDVRAAEFGEHVRRVKEALAKEFEDYKVLKGREEVDATEKCEADRMKVEKDYRLLIAKAEKQLKAAKEADEAAQLELMPVQSVYDDMHTAAAKLQDLTARCKAARDDATKKEAEFRAKYSKLQDDQSNLQARSSKGTDSKPFPEDAPLDAEMAYLERQANDYQSKQKQLDEELERLTADQEKCGSELEKFGKTYRPVKEKADESRASLAKRAEELETLNQRKDAEVTASERRCQGELERIKSERAEAEAELGHRIASLNQSFEGIQSSLTHLKQTLTSAGKYAEEIIVPGLRTVTISEGDTSRELYYPFYLGMKEGSSSPMPIFGREWKSQVQEAQSGTRSGPDYAQAAIDSYIQGRVSSLRWSNTGNSFNLFAQVEFKGRLLMGFKELAVKGSMSKSRMLRLAKEVAVINLEVP